MKSTINQQGLNIATYGQAYYKPDDPYEYRVKDLKSAVNKEYLNEKCLRKDARGNYFVLEGNVINNSEPY